ncbi:PUA-like domain-containing protein [Dichotomocladium elegans]|nr:PUA-like domain-containing protein [Dichotomocladium elegans]
MIANLLECPGCSTVFRDPITTHCGHVYCRLCLLKFKIVSKPCMQCKSPLPQFNHFFNRAATNRIIQRLIEAHVSGVSDRETISDLESSFQRSVFVTGLVVLPKQHVRLPVFTPNHLRMLRHAIFSSGSRLLLAAVHSSRSTMAKFGTIAEITMVDQCKSGTLLLDVVGLERFTASYIEDDHLGQHMKGDMSLLTAQCTLIRNHHPRDLQDHEDIEALASHIRHLLKQLARSPPPALLLGVLWFETMQRIHGQLPATGAEDTLWWTAAALPLNAAERYELLRTIPLYDKLDLVLSRIKQLISQ